MDNGTKQRGDHVSDLDDIPCFTDGFCKEPETIQRVARGDYKRLTPKPSWGNGEVDACMGVWRVKLVERGISNRAFDAAVNYMVANDIAQDIEVLHTIAAEFEGSLR